MEWLCIDCGVCVYLYIMYCGVYHVYRCILMVLDEGSIQHVGVIYRVSATHDQVKIILDET